ncbi:MAG: STAS domain-containing protein [Prevotellaceae bacterium]|jgi:anti-anti-sigma factor|nr:STAS domain-containing protein [Prevotellaceae bacterium]
MKIKVLQNEEKTTLTLTGRLDATTSQALQDALMPHLGKNKHVELDLAKLAYTSSAGLRVLLMGEKTAKAQEGRLTLVNVTPEVMEVFEMTGFSGILHFE